MVHLYEGINYTIDVVRGIATHNIYSRPEISYEEGAAAGREMRMLHEELSLKEDIQGMVINFSEAPISQGPKTRAAFAEILAFWEAVKRPIALMIPDSMAMLRMQLTRIARMSSPAHGRVVSTLSIAEDWARGKITLEPTLNSGIFVAIKKTK